MHCASAADALQTASLARFPALAACCVMLHQDWHWQGACHTREPFLRLCWFDSCLHC